MRGLVKQSASPRDAAVKQVAEPEAGPDDVLVAVEACGICGTDVALYEGPAEFADEMGMEFPIVFGHEFAGRISFVGARVDGLSVGELVTANPHLFCGDCHFCRSGQPEICDDRPVIGIHRPGGFADVVAVRARNVYQVPPAVPAAVAALAEPLAVAAHAVRRENCGSGNFVCVVGPGPIGLLIGLACQEAGVERVVVVGRDGNAMRLSIANAIGLETTEIDDADAARSLAADLPADGSTLVFDASGSPSGLQTALMLAPKAGSVLALGVAHEAVAIDVAGLTLDEKSLIGCRGYAPVDWRRSMTIMARRSGDLASLVTNELSLAEFESAFGLLRERQAVKVVLSPAGSAA